MLQFEVHSGPIFFVDDEILVHPEIGLNSPISFHRASMYHWTTQKFLLLFDCALSSPELDKQIYMLIYVLRERCFSKLCQARTHSTNSLVAII